MSILNEEYLSNIRNDYKKVILEKLRFQITKYIQEEQLHLLANNLRLDTKDHLTSIGRDLALRLSTWALTNKVESFEILRIPKTWWDHFKLTYFPDWLYNRFPASFEEIKKMMVHHHICPHLNLKLDETKPHYEFLCQSTNSDLPLDVY